MRRTFAKAFAAAALLGTTVVASEAVGAPGPAAGSALDRSGTVIEQARSRYRDRLRPFRPARSTYRYPSRLRPFHRSASRSRAQLRPFHRSASRARAQLRPFRRSAYGYPTRLRPAPRRPAYRAVLRRQPGADRARRRELDRLYRQWGFEYGRAGREHYQRQQDEERLQYERASRRYNEDWRRYQARRRIRERLGW
jgi:hypothetical protein